MSSADQNDEIQGVSHLGELPNNSSEDGGQVPCPENEHDEEVDEDLSPFVPPARAEACKSCEIYETEADSLVSQLTEKKEEISNLTHSLRATHTELESLKKENEAFVHGKHELNNLRALVVNVTNLGVPVTDHFGPDQIFMDDVKPSAQAKPFINNLTLVPSGTWGQMRSIQVESPSGALTSEFVSSSSADYYIAKEYAEYRKALAQYLDNAKLFLCASCLRPLYKQLKWLLCLRCLAVPYCSTYCIHSHKPAHALVCKTHHVWRADIEPPKPTTTTESTSISTSSSSSEGKGGKGKGKGKGKGQHDQHSSRKRPRTCWHFTNRGSCKDGDQCNALHDNEARLRHLDDERKRLQSSLSPVVQLPRSYGTDDGDADGDDAYWQ
jgi:hypothetical protein